MPRILLLIITTFALILLAGQTYSENSISEKSENWSLAEARQIVSDFHVLKPKDRDIPTERVEFRRWLQVIDPHSSITRIVTKTTSYGLLQFHHNGREYALPIVGGAAWNAGLTSAIEILDLDLLITRGIVVGIDLQTDLYIRKTLKPKYITPGRVERTTIGGLAAVRVTSFIEGNTVQSARKIIRPESMLARKTPFSSVQVPGSVKDDQANSKYPTVLDLRYCVGGDIYEATDFGGLWLKAVQDWVEIKNTGRGVVPLRAAGKQTNTFQLDSILVSRHTASACEQLVMGLMTYTEAKVYGEKTAGKCSVQTTKRLSQGYLLKLTTGEWAGPQGQSCNAAGIEPDVRFKGNIHDDRAVADWLTSVLSQG